MPAGSFSSRRRLGMLVLLVAAAAAASASAADLDPARGRFLVAERDLDDPNFAETVVLLVDYDASGAMGLIVNWPTAAPAAELLPEIDGIAERAGMVWVGGPVERRLVLMLMRSESELPEAEQILSGVHLSTSNELLQRVVSGELAVGELRLYSGYAGWAPGQLDLELAAGGWRVVPAEADLVFHPDPDRLWSVLMKRSGVQWTRRGTAGVPAAPWPALLTSSLLRGRMHLDLRDFPLSGILGLLRVGLWCPRSERAGPRDPLARSPGTYGHSPSEPVRRAG